MVAPKGTYGPGIIGEEQYAKELHQTTAGRSIFGPGITGDWPEESEEEAVQEEATEEVVEELVEEKSDKPLDPDPTQASRK
jgi:hypothetical protein